MRTLALALLVLGLCAFAPGCKKRANSPDGGDQNGSDAPGAPPGPRGGGTSGTFAVGKKTTYVTGPVDAGGYIDYAAALNAHFSKGVTAENNANVAIWKVIGPTPPVGSVPPGYFEKMGVQPPPATGEYLVALKAFAERNGGNVGAAFDASKRFREQPWTTSQDALLSNWLKANHKPLTALRAAVKKTHYYNPIIPQSDAMGSKGLITSPMPGPQACYEIAGAFACRAMLFLGHNQTAEAWQDLLACHRLARLVGRGGTTIEALIATALEQIACRADVAFLDRARPDAATLAACLKDLRSLPPLPSVAEKVDLCERFSFLENLMLLDRRGYAHVAPTLEDPRAAPENMFNRLVKGIDWNPAMEKANALYDEMAAALREKDRAARNRRLAQVAAEKGKYWDEHRFGWPSLLLRVDPSDHPPAKRGLAVGELYLSLLMPDARKVQDAADRTVQMHENVVAAFALSWYQRFNGRYPARLAELAPTYLTKVPADLFTGKELGYQPDAQGFLLYSAGLNERDDAGRGDDLVVRIPQPAKK